MSKHSSVGQSLRTLPARIAAAVMGLLVAGQALAYTNTSDGWNLPTGVTAIAKDVYHLHMVVFWVCVFIAVVVFGVMFYSVFAHRKSKGHAPANFHESTTVEIIWTIIPFVILIALAIPAAGILIKQETVGKADINIKVTGYQWKWQYEYLDGSNISFFSTLSRESNVARQEGLKDAGTPASLFSAAAWANATSSEVQEKLKQVDGGHYLANVDNPLVLPVGKKIKLLLTGNDVIHAWWVPDLAVKKDAIPGYINEIWFNIETPGIYRGVCAELCGRDHGFMPIVVKAVPEAEYAAWIASGGKNTDAAAAAPAAAEVASAAAAPAAPAVAEPAKDMGKDELVKHGEEVYKANCAACHQANGEGLPPNFPSLKGSKVANGPAKAHIEQVLNGKGLMQPFKNLSDADIAAVASYERTSWGNKGSLVQPKDVAAARQ